MRLPPPLPAGPRRPWAEASVDETDTWGLRLLGVPLRDGPHVMAGLVGTVAHGDRLRATCWARGDLLTNAFPENRRGAYDSDVWYRVEAAGRSAFIPDVRFGRRGTTDRLGLPQCAPPAGGRPGAGLTGRDISE